jgi:3-oxoadipate enol-lactonase
MATVRASDGIDLHYDVLGRAHREPLLMIQGLGADMSGWAFQRVAFAGSYRTIALDNRGAGRSDKPVGPYSLEQMADDAIAVLDKAGIERAHVMGASMGGAIAQILAVKHPERVRSLVLACTACRHHPWRRELLASWADVAEHQGMRQLARVAMRFLVEPRSFRRFGPALGLMGPFALAAPGYAFAAQIGAILDTDDALRLALPFLNVPTLVVVGNQDILTPRGDSEELAELIPGAELVVIAGAAHGLMVEHASTFNRVVLDFLATVGRQAADGTVGRQGAAPVLG